MPSSSGPHLRCTGRSRPFIALLVLLVLGAHSSTRVRTQEFAFGVRDREERRAIGGVASLLPRESIEVDLTLASSNIADSVGPSGWSLSLAVESNEYTLVDVTWDGTVSAEVAAGGRAEFGFRIAEIVDPDAHEGQGAGLIAATILSLPAAAVTLPPNSEHLILRARLASEGFFGEGVRLEYRNGLQGRSTTAPVLNQVTFRNVAVDAELGSTTISAFPPCLEEGCHFQGCQDGIDDDGDGLIDCEDPDCARTCPPAYTLVAEAPASALGEVELRLFICPTSLESPPRDGAQGWSLGLEHTGPIVGVGEPTLLGTDAGALLSGGFEKTEFVDPARNAGRAGLVSAVVLSFTQPITLDPTRCQSVLRARYVPTELASAVFLGEAEFRFVDGLRGSGQPVDTVLTVNGGTVRALGRGTVVTIGGTPRPAFVRGDANDDARVDIADAVWVVNLLVREGPVSPCLSAADVNADTRIDLSDVMYLIQYRFLGGSPPPAPFPRCDLLDSGDSLGCEVFGCF